MERKRITAAWAIALAVIIPLGLGSRQVAWLPEQTGDALWTMALFCLLRMLFPGARIRTVALASLAISVLDELSQLIRWEWLDAVRATTAGHLILGQGFDAWDIAAYTAGALLMWAAAPSIEKGLIKQHE